MNKEEKFITDSLRLFHQLGFPPFLSIVSKLTQVTLTQVINARITLSRVKSVMMRVPERGGVGL